MALPYDEGEYTAFQKLQYEIVRLGGDESIFVWKADDAFTVREYDDRKMLTYDEIPYIVPLAC